ncbi:LysR family transcriptional regulator [Salinisphaera sp. USBA-960]|uniref:LysR family transcriptional regulator n=1 Tax=Salinisphaera orenii TaxID=856731 RepID=UPI000DBE4A7C|nr:LysR family transcriptional regulator [Salifodinibacter halophilus]NNC25597.1 LysR family transcriptional regulator [Salifodinibacter halophilus]
MELRQLRYFVAVAEEKHFGRAAARMHISQPPLSMQIRHLEEGLGVLLLDRHTRKVMLTNAGRTFLQYAYRILATVAESEQAVTESDAGLRGRLEVGFISSATLTVLPPALREFRRQYPAVELELKEISSGDQIDALYSGDIQIGLLRLPLQARGLQIEPLRCETLTVALPENHALAAQPSISPLTLADHPLIFFDRQHIPGLHDHIEGLFQNLGREPWIAQHAISLQTIVGLVASDIGLAILPESCHHLRRDGVVYRPLDATDTETWMALAHPSATDSRLVTHFKQTIQTVLAGY